MGSSNRFLFRFDTLSALFDRKTVKMPPKKKKDAEEDKKPAIMGRMGTNLKSGIVGLPNVGKSTFFNVLTKSSAPAENFPFCTIDPNESRVPVPDARWDWLCDYHKPASKVPAFLNIMDIAGLVKGASEGQGLGNAFLSHIRACDALFHVRSGDKKIKEQLDVMTKIHHVLVEEKKPVRFANWDSKELEELNKHLLITSKPMIYLCNLSEKDYIRKKNKWLPKIKAYVDEHDPGSVMIPFSGSLELDMIDMSEEEKEAFLKEKGITSAMEKIIVTGYKSLGLIYFFTCGEDEVKAWTIQKGDKAPQAAGKIHTDFEKGFIMAEIMKYDDFKEAGSEAGVKAAGKYKQKGRDYVVEDGDIIFFKANAGAGLGGKKK